MPGITHKGIALPLSLIILAIVLAITLGLSALLTGQIRTVRSIGDSVVALYAADTGVEAALRGVFDYIRDDGDSLEDLYRGSLSNGATYRARVRCSQDLDDCPIAEDCPSGVSAKSWCKASCFCIRSRGTFGTGDDQVKRAIEVKLWPLPSP